MQRALKCTAKRDGSAQVGRHSKITPSLRHLIMRAGNRKSFPTSQIVKQMSVVISMETFKRILQEFDNLECVGMKSHYFLTFAPLHDRMKRVR